MLTHQAEPVVVSADVHQDRLAVRRRRLQLDQHARALREPVQRRLPHDEETRGEGSACLIAVQEPLHEVMLAGTSTRILNAAAADGSLNVEKPYHSSNPDEAVAFGAKKQASTLSDSNNLPGLLVLNVTMLSL
ncbi:hypothetical protein F443_05278 [Phytophthora nicotianae P1569]|uniref:Uncharacterized protein n=1 Tax=Phytophthora nicotianae P1569 TaxID=1317065 RepID=V9FKR1_PHYNI|nr:hypothetical protein F443_05278 [Phytophthora nicotianae P1569]